MSRVVITGYGVVTPYGVGFDEMANGINNNINCFVDQEVHVHKNSKPVILPTGRVPISLEDYSDIPDNISRLMTPMTLFAYLAYKEAKDKALLSNIDAAKAGIFLASTLPHINTKERQLATDIFKTFTNTPAFVLAEMIGTTGRVIAPCSACSTGLQAINLATEAIQSGKLDVAICGATEEWSEDLAKIFIKLGIASKTRCRPFADDRDGIIVSEGAGILILESEEHAKNRLANYTRIIAGTGYSFSSNPSVATEESILKSMIDAYSHFHLNKNLGYQNEIVACVHATGTPMGDAAELNALNKFKDLVYLNDYTRVNTVYYKHHLGHTMAASGVIELIASLHRTVPVLNNAFGLGGVNCSTLVTPKTYIGE